MCIRDSISEISIIGRGADNNLAGQEYPGVLILKKFDRYFLSFLTDAKIHHDFHIIPFPSLPFRIVDIVDIAFLTVDEGVVSSFAIFFTAGG